jgi:hypothetical protein
MGEQRVAAVPEGEDEGRAGQPDGAEDSSDSVARPARGDHRPDACVHQQNGHKDGSEREAELPLRRPGVAASITRPATPNAT